MHPAALDPALLVAECRERGVRRSGPGGQHRNKVETGVVLEHPATGIAAEAAERRSRAENRTVALRRLRVRLAIGHREAPGDAPSDLWRRRTAGGKIAVSLDHDDFPALLAESLDRIAAEGLAMPTAAAALGVSATQLLRFLAREPAALEHVQRLRSAAGLPRLRA